MDKVKGIAIIIIAIVSVIVTVLVANVLLDTTGKVNQGNYRISDVIVRSSADVKEVQDENVELTKLSDMIFDITQTNQISILIDPNVKANNIRIENLTVSDPILRGKMEIYQNEDKKYDITPELKSIELDLEQENEKYVLNLYINNKDVLTGQRVAENVETIQYDATMFKTLGIDISSLKFNVSFDLLITDEAGNTVKTTIALNMPTDETVEKGMSILKQDTSDYIFTII